MLSPSTESLLAHGPKYAPAVANTRVDQLAAVYEIAAKIPEDSRQDFVAAGSRAVCFHGGTRKTKNAATPAIKELQSVELEVLQANKTGRFVILNKEQMQEKTDETLKKNFLPLQSRPSGSLRCKDGDPPGPDRGAEPRRPPAGTRVLLPLRGHTRRGEEAKKTSRVASSSTAGRPRGRPWEGAAERHRPVVIITRGRGENGDSIGRQMGIGGRRARRAVARGARAGRWSLLLLTGADRARGLLKDGVAVDIVVAEAVPESEEAFSSSRLSELRARHNAGGGFQ
ncbi:hypothetical protein ISCGN_003160 [Ixodes scapularis]